MGQVSLPFDPGPSAHRKGGSTIRRLLIGIPLALITLALIVPASPTAAGIRKVALGVTIEHHNRDVQTFNRFADQVNNTPRIWTLWSTWGNQSTKDFPSGAASWVAAKGAVPIDLLGAVLRLQQLHVRRPSAHGQRRLRLVHRAMGAGCEGAPRDDHPALGARDQWRLLSLGHQEHDVPGHQRGLQGRVAAHPRHLRPGGRGQREVPLDDRQVDAVAARAPTRTQASTPATPTSITSASATSTGAPTRTNGPRWSLG